jgi:predicted AlkP superfamily pyrophosphatase or phosphodiesterase
LEDHGIVGLTRPKSDLLAKIEGLNRYEFFSRFSGLRRKLYKELPFVEGSSRKPDKGDLECETFFHRISNSKAIDVPSYNIGYSVDLMSILERCGVEEAVKELDRFEKYKKNELFEAMEEDYDLLMAHFHKPDHIHHWYWEVGKIEKVEEMYREMDEFAEEIIEKAKGKFDTIIFMSDHGLPDVERGGHNDNAFYSCNNELFPESTPHITDFHDKILALANKTVGIDREIEDIRV